MVDLCSVRHVVLLRTVLHSARHACSRACECVAVRCGVCVCVALLRTVGEPWVVPFSSTKRAACLTVWRGDARAVADCVVLVCPPYLARGGGVLYKLCDIS